MVKQSRTCEDLLWLFFAPGFPPMPWESLNRAIRASARLSKTLAIGASRSDLVPEMKHRICAPVISLIVQTTR